MSKRYQPSPRRDKPGRLQFDWCERAYLGSLAVVWCPYTGAVWIYTLAETI